MLSETGNVTGALGFFAEERPGCPTQMTDIDTDGVAQLGHAALRQASSAHDAVTRVAWEKQAIKHFREAANERHASSAFNLGFCHAKGLGDLSASETEAAMWYQQAMDGGDVYGAFNMVWVSVSSAHIVSHASEPIA